MEKHEMSPASRRLLGLRDFPTVDAETRAALLGEGARAEAWKNIETTTLPQGPKREMKKSVVLEILKQELLSAEALREHPMVYIGSGADIEYPLSLGGRQIVLVDPMFSDSNTMDEVIERIRDIGIEASNPTEDHRVQFDFDFGEGQEHVTVKLVPEMYRPNGEIDVIPNDSGVIILFASQGPDGSVQIDEEMKSKLVDGGVIIDEADVISYDESGREMRAELGQKYT